MPSFNDMDIKRWKESKVWTDSLWIIPKRDNTTKHSRAYHGNFVPQIPRQLMLRYTKQNETVLDPFVGSGTSAYEAENLNRNFIGIDIQNKLIEEIKQSIEEKNNFSALINADSTKKQTFKRVEEILNKHKQNKVQLAILHPPYTDIIKFSGHKNDLSNSKSLEDFMEKFCEVIKNTLSVLEKNRYLAIVIGDKYTKGQWIPLAFYCLNEALKLNLTLKSIVIKNIESNRSKRNKEAIWRYRALTSDYYIFKHEYIFIFKNTK